MYTMALTICLVVFSSVLPVILYLLHVNRAMNHVPEEARHLSPHRWTVDEVKAAYKKAVEDPVDVRKSLPPRQGRRYIVVGGSGLVGAWIVCHLLDRGEDPLAIRVLDLKPPRQEILDAGIGYIKTDIADKDSVSDAFLHSPWPNSVARLPLTVFHNAAVIRPGERAKDFLPLCSKVNVDGARNVVNAAKEAGASVLIATSSGSICLRSVSFWIPPWETCPRNLVQVISDSTSVPTEHDEFFGNYAVSKSEAERIVRGADEASSGFRTGCIRPTNGIYGIGYDTTATVTGNYLSTGVNPCWNPQVIHSWANAENVSIAHLCYEQRLIELTHQQQQKQLSSPKNKKLPDIGGSAYTVTDPNPPLAFRDINLLLTTLSETPVKFPLVPPLPFLVLAHLVEWYSFLHHRYLSRSRFLSFLPKVSGDLAILQPALFSISDVNVIADDSRARLKPEQGGLGYSAPLTSLDGMCKEVEEWNRRHSREKAVPAPSFTPAAAVAAAARVTGDGC